MISYEFSYSPAIKLIDSSRPVKVGKGGQKTSQIEIQLILRSIRRLVSNLNQASSLDFALSGIEKKEFLNSML